MGESSGVAGRSLELLVECDSLRSESAREVDDLALEVLEYRRGWREVEAEEEGVGEGMRYDPRSSAASSFLDDLRPMRPSSRRPPPSIDRRPSEALRSIATDAGAGTVLEGRNDMLLLDLRAPAGLGVVGVVGGSWAARLAASQAGTSEPERERVEEVKEDGSGESR